MSDRGDTREQPSIPESAQLSTEHAGLAITIVALTSAVGALVVESITRLDLLAKGAYSVLAALTVCGVVTYFGARILRELTRLRAGQVVVRETLRQRQAAGQLAREPVGARFGHRSRGGDQVDYWTVYTDVLEDLGGLDDTPSSN